jgi:zinc transporter ZupT
LPQDQDESIIAATTNYSQPENDIVDTRRTDEQFDPERQSTFRVLLLVFALSLHAIFEGLSIGMISTPTVLFQVLNHYPIIEGTRKNHL